MVGFGLVRVSTREAAQGIVQPARGTDISGDHGRSARAGMPLGKQVADDLAKMADYAQKLKAAAVAAKAAVVLAAAELVLAGGCDVEDLAAQRQHRLRGAIPRLFRRAAGRIALDDEQFGECRIALLAVGQLAGQRRHVQRALAPGQFARLAGGLARGGGEVLGLPVGRIAPGFRPKAPGPTVGACSMSLSLGEASLVVLQPSKPATRSYPPAHKPSQKNQLG